MIHHKGELSEVLGQPKVESIELREDEVLLRAYARSVKFRPHVTVRGSELAQIIEAGLAWRDRCRRAERALDSDRFALRGNKAQ